MKYVKYALIFLGCLIVGFLLFMVFSKDRFEVTIEDRAHAASSEVFELLTDTSFMMDWKAGVVKVEVLKGTPGEKGCEYALTYKPDNQELVIKETLVDFERHQKLIYRVVAPKIFSENRTITLTDSADWVKISINREVKAENWLVKFFLSQLAQALPQETEAELRAIKQLVIDRGTLQL